jgi:RNA recognition motif-containing protein
MSSTPSPQTTTRTRTPEGKKRKRYEEETSDEPESSDSEQENISAESVDEPVLSHAAKRKQRRKEQSSGEQDLALSVKKRKLKGGSAAPTKLSTKNDHVKVNSQKKQNSIWIGNLSFRTTEENIRTFFEERSIGTIIRINLPMKAAKGPGLKKENRGFVRQHYCRPCFQC